MSAKKATNKTGIRQDRSQVKRTPGAPEADPMQQVIDRLRREKAESEKAFCEQGIRDAFKWAPKATYGQLLYALNHVPMAQEKLLIDYDPTEDPILGDYFRRIIDEDEGMDFEETIPGHFVPNALFEAWEKGFFEAVHRFWDGIKSKLKT